MRQPHKSNHNIKILILIIMINIAFLIIKIIPFFTIAILKYLKYPLLTCHVRSVNSKGWG